MQTLKKRADFLHLNRNGKRASTRAVVLQSLKNDLNVIRVGYTVTKATEKSAVRRNRIKRRLRAAAKEIIKTGAKPAHDYVLIGKKEAGEMPYQALCEDIRGCLSKLGCLN